MSSKTLEHPISLLYSTTNALLIISLLSVVIWYVQFRWNRRRLYKMCAKIPHVKDNLPIFGAAFSILADKSKFLDKLLGYCKEGTPNVMWIGYMPMIIVDVPEDIEIILNSSKALAKSTLYKFLADSLGDGILTGPVNIWKVHRKAIAPTFNQKVLNTFFSSFVKQSEYFLNILQDSVGKTVNMSDHLNKWSLNSICETAMGVQLETQKDMLIHSLHRAMEIIVDRAFNIAYHSNFIFYSTSIGREFLKLLNYGNGFIFDVLKEKRLSYEKKRLQNIETPEAEIDGTPKLVPFLDLLMELTHEKGKFTDEELKNETITIMFAGSETTATAIGYILLLLGMNPDVQQKLYEELDGILGPHRQITLSDLNLFKYMDRVIKESLRILPVVPFYYRNIDEDLNLTSTTLPKGSSVALAIMPLHRSPKFWTDPLKFDPDRFLPEQVEKRNRYAYVPFSAGPRNCVGIKYAMMSMKTLLAMLVRRYHISTNYKSVDEIRLSLDVVLKSVDGFPVKLTERNI